MPLQISRLQLITVRISKSFNYQPEADPEAAARVLRRINKKDHVSLVLASLHWLPVKSRIDFKILLLALNHPGPSYLRLDFVYENQVQEIQLQLQTKSNLRQKKGLLKA